MRLQGSMTCTCDYSLKACMHSSHVSHGLCLTPGGERTGAPRCCESTLACRRRLRPYWHQGRGGAARRGTNRVLRQPAACVRHLRRHTGHRDHVHGLWRAGGACGLGAWRGPAPSAARTRVPKLQPCVPRLQSSAVKAANYAHARQVSTFGTTDVSSEAYAFAVGGIDTSQASMVQATAPAVTGAAGALAALQGSDVDVLDAACNSALSSTYGDRMGARLTPAAPTAL